MGYGIGICLDNIREIWNGNIQGNMEWILWNGKYGMDIMGWGYGMGNMEWILWDGDMGWDNTGDRRYKINVYDHGVGRVGEAD